MHSDVLNPLTVYSESPFINTITYLEVSFALQKSVIYQGFVEITF